MMTTLLTIVLVLLAPTTKLHALKDVGLVVKPLFSIIIEESLKIYAAYQEAAQKAKTPPADVTATKETETL